MTLPLEDLSEATGIPISTLYPDSDKGNVHTRAYSMANNICSGVSSANVIVMEKPSSRASSPIISIPASIIPIFQKVIIRQLELRALGAELELGLYHPDGTAPTEEEVATFSESYRNKRQYAGYHPDS